MTSPQRPGLFGRLYASLKRGVLGRGTQEYGARFTGTDAYWERMLARQRGWPRHETPGPAPSREAIKSDAGAER
jgi:hypothetical protein